MVTAVAGLLALGLVMLYSAGMAQTGARYLTMQLAWGGIGLVACMATAVFDYRWLQRLALPITTVTLLLLLLVLLVLVIMPLLTILEKSIPQLRRN